MEKEYNFHLPVMLNEVVENADLKANSIVVDMTLGRAGHSSEFLKRIPQGFLYGFDQDTSALTYSSKRLSAIGDNFKTIHSRFSHIGEELPAIGVNKVDFIFYDLGVSSPQFDDPDRGFSYRFDSPLDMRMDRDNFAVRSAKEIVNKEEPGVLVKALFEFADERFAKQIVHNIVKHRQVKPIETTFELVDIIKEALPAKELHKEGHPAKKTFMAIRYLVNHEKDEIVNGIPEGLKLLKVGGRLAVLTFNSYEDGLVKSIFKEHTSKEVVNKYLPPVDDKLIQFKLVTKKPLVPSEEEMTTNPRSKPAKLRIIERIAENEK